MLLTNRRHRILFITLAAMEVAWFLPFALTVFIQMQRGADAAGIVRLPALLLYSGGWAPLVFFGIAWGTLLLYLLSADLLNRRGLESPLREAAMVGVVVGTFLLTTRLLVFPTVGLFTIGWLGATLGAIYNQGPGSSIILFLLIFNLFLWIRVATATNRSLTFLSVGMSFRLGLLFALLGNALLILVAQQPVEQGLLYLWIFFGFGLLAVAVARIDEKAFRATQSSGSTLPWGRFTQLVLVTIGALGIAIGSSLFYTPLAVRTVLGWFTPLWNFLGGILFYLFSALFLLIGPLLDRFIEAVRAFIANLEPLANGEGEFGPLEQNADPIDFGEVVQNVMFVRYCMITAILLGVLLLIWLLFVRTRERPLAEETEQTDGAGFTGVGNPFQRLRDLAGLFRNYGLRPGLLAAISVQNIYANTSRLADRRGYPRPPAQPPDEYLRTLRVAFPGHDAALRRLTDAYMRVHYGDQPITGEELAGLRADYTAMQATPVTAE